MEDATCEKSNYSGRIVSAPSRGHGLDQEPKSDNVDKRIEFLRTQHAETLSYLHREIERLKAENKGKYFVMIPIPVEFYLLVSYQCKVEKLPLMLYSVFMYLQI